MIYELRRYVAAPGKLDALVARFVVGDAADDRVLPAAPFAPRQIPAYQS